MSLKLIWKTNRKRVVDPRGSNSQIQITFPALLLQSLIELRSQIELELPREQFTCSALMKRSWMGSSSLILYLFTYSGSLIPHLIYTFTLKDPIHTSPSDPLTGSCLGKKNTYKSPLRGLQA